MSQPPILEYSRQKRSRRWRLLSVVLVSVTAVGVAVYFRSEIRSAIHERLEAWRFSSRFDRARAAFFTSSDTLWTRAANGAAADRLLDELLTSSRSGARQYRGVKPLVVLFVRSGTTTGRSWMAFACLTSTGVEVFSFERDDRRQVGYDRLLETRQFWRRSNSEAVRLAAGAVSESGDVVTTVVYVNGTANTLDWTFAPAPPGVGRTNMAYASRLLTPQVVPRTGWVWEREWWPNADGVTLLEGRPPDQELDSGLDAVSGGFGVAFLPDGRIAVAATGSIAVASPAGGAPQVRPLPEARHADTAAFSPDGAWCYLAGTSTDEYLVDVLGGAARRIGESHGAPRPFFEGDRTLIVYDNTRIRNFDVSSGVVTEEPKPAEHLKAFHRAGGAVAYAAYETRPSGVYVRRGPHTLEIGGIDPAYQPLSLSPDGRWLAFKGTGLSLFDATNGELVWEHDLNHDLGTPQSQIKWTPDGKYGATAGYRYAYVWSATEPRWAARFPHGRKGSNADVALSSDGSSMAASASGSATVAYWKRWTTATRPAD